MGYCQFCGNIIGDGDGFCQACGSPVSGYQQITPQFQQAMMQGQQYENPQYQQAMTQAEQYGAPQQAMMQGQQYGMPQQFVAPENLANIAPSGKQKNKKVLLIAIIAVLVVAAGGVGAFFLFGKKKPKEAEQALKNYFEAVNSLDMNAVYDACYPAGSTADRKTNVSAFQFFTRELLFMQGIPQGLEMMRMDHDLMTAYYSDYGYTGSYSDMAEEYRAATSDSSRIKEAMPGFKASYTLKKLEKASACEISYRNGLKYVDVDNIEEHIESQYGIQIENGEVYAAEIGIYWEYNGMPYGNKKSWWEIDAFQRVTENNQNFNSYESTIDYFDQQVYHTLIYKCDGEWYVWNPYIIKNAQVWYIEMH